MTDNVNRVATASPAPSEVAVFRKVSLRLLPFLFLLYVINLIDRTNIGIARLQMVDQQHILEEEAYALGAGIFYVGYLLFEVPSNLILLRLGPRVWIARILVSWGLISAAMMFVTGPWSFGILRVLLGVAEAGFFPGIIYYLSDWFPARVRARAVAHFMVGGVIASMVGNPISGFILQFMDQVGGLWGWQWVFLLEGLPAVALGFVTLAYLTDRPDQARWLSPAERTWLAHQIDNERNYRPHSRSHSLAAAVLDLRVWLLIAIYFTVAMGDNSYGFYIPTFLRSQFPDWSPFQIGVLAAAPSVIAMVAMVLVGRNSDRTGERHWHVACSALTAALGWLMIALVASGRLAIPGLDSRWLFVGGVAMTLTGMKCMLPTFWTLPPSFLTGAAAAGGIALINSVANLGGMLGPRIIGHVKMSTGSFTVGYLVMAATLFMGGLLVLSVKNRIHREPD
ncbi:MAG TPA: MFS transporter [Gemmataceae bacterium]|nr:MFS transporter [Gemmataceae bacterium]